MSSVLHLVANVTPAARERIAPVHRGFDVVRRAIAASQTPADPTPESVYDRYTVADVERVTSELIAPEPSLLVNGYWTLGRATPRHGAPWASVTIDENNGCAYFRVRIAGTFDDIEDPPLWAACRVDNDLREFGSVLMDAGSVDFWWTVDGTKLRITVVAKDIVNFAA
jgi:hypothetical protein